MQPPFSISIRVYYEDTDAGGVVFYANYLKYMERARTEWLRQLGFEQDELSMRERVLFAVRSVKLDFIKPARFNDLLHTTVTVGKRGNASLTFLQQVQRDAVALCQGEIKVACLDVDSFMPRSIPEQIISQLNQLRSAS
jgi:acyl-CoA thioester hydrolase